MKVLLDIGAHTGETLEAVMPARWGFERIVSFEPAPVCWPSLESLADDRVEVCRFGLWHEDATIELHNPGAVGASMSADKDPETAAPVPCEFRDVAEWFEKNLTGDDEVFVKINAEGAEAEIIGRLHDTGQLGLIDHLLIHFDVRKIPSRRHLEQQLRDQLAQSGIEYQLAEDIQFGGAVRGTRNWLAWCHADKRIRDLRYKTLRRAGHAVRVRLYPVKMRAMKALARS